MGNTRVIGLTGGIGSGKSTVAEMLRERGHPVVDADQLARDVVRPGQPAHAEIVASFGPAVLASDGTIDRKALADRAFADPESRTRLNAITHPRIAAAAALQLAEYRSAGKPLVFYEAALIVENGLHKVPGLLDALCVVSAPAEVQVERALARGGRSVEEQDIRRRIAAQAPLEEKVRAADYVIDNSRDLAATRAQVDAMLRDLLTGKATTRARRSRQGANGT